ncbi:peptide chain release factor PrfB3, chloroplastic [Tripterygium wilfordii]|uniref:peptide chain release factor PrfB3, chloroplastic n=1 Tax=Tripterygium wilfordii TaxID=458696 RepID=UPI0018F8393B|nr:peptide chain release factor PrfB3, chloroplastic [Tripterygium wilfordii]
MATEALFIRGAKSTDYLFPSMRRESTTSRHPLRVLVSSKIRASSSTDGKKNAYKELGLFSLKKKIDDVLLRAEMLGPTALELEETRRIAQEQIMRDFNLWDDPDKSNEILAELADRVRVIDALKDVKYKAEDAKLITELSEIDAITCGLVEQAYSASLDVSMLLDKYEMSKFLQGPCDVEGACVIIKAGLDGTESEKWVEKLLSMYIKWAKKQGHRGRVVDKHPSVSGGIKSAGIEFEFENAYGYLSGERGVHRMIGFQNGSIDNKVSLAGVDVVPLFLGATPDLQINDEDLIVSSPPLFGEKYGLSEAAVCIQHIPTGICVQSTGERTLFANKTKALNRLKAKLLVIAEEQKISDLSSIKRDAIVDVWKNETRRYILQPRKLVQDVKTGIQLTDLNSVLNGNIEPLIGARFNYRQSSNVV